MSTSVYDKIIEKAKLDASKIIADGTAKLKELDLLTKEEVEKEKSAALKDASLKDEERVLVYKASLEQSFNQQRLAHQKELLQKVIDQTKQELMNLSDNELIAFVKNHIRKANIEKAIIKAELGITPNSDGICIRLQFPPLTEERRKEIVKDVKKIGEDAKVAVRNIRRDAKRSVRM